MGYGHLRLDPALPPYLLGEMDAAEQEQMRARWAEGMTGLTRFLYQQRSKDARLAQQLALLELPNLLALLRWAQGRATPGEVVDLAGQVGDLIARLGRPQALAQATRVREEPAGELGEWSHDQFIASNRNIDRLLEAGDLPPARAAAEQLLKRCLDAGEEAYPGADYDTAVAHWQLGGTLQLSGAAEAALQHLAQAQGLFQALADVGNTGAERMAFVAIAGSADCLRDLGRLDKAAAAYEEAIERHEKLNHKRGVAVSKGNLAAVRCQQGRYAEALDISAEALKIFDGLGEPGSVADVWHQMGIVHRWAEQHEQAEDAHRRSLAISVRQKNRLHEAFSLTELGNLYNVMGRPEEAAAFCRQAAGICVELQDLNHEGAARNSMAICLIKLGRCDAARRELRRAIECKKPYGHAAQPWRTWGLLHDVEEATGNTLAAAGARGQAMESYLAYRRAGGESQAPTTKLYALVAQAIQQGDTAQARQFLTEVSGPADTPPWLKAMTDKLQAIVDGNRDPGLADDPDLDYRDAVEVQLLLENL